MIPTLDKLDIDSKLIAIMIVLEALFEAKKTVPLEVNNYMQEATDLANPS